MKKQQRPLDPALATSMTVTRMPELEPSLPRVATPDSVQGRWQGPWQ
jgi:hypothetical protein